MGQAIAPILGGLGLVTGLIDNDKNRSAQNAALGQASAAQNASLAQQQEYLDMIKERYNLIKQVIEQGKYNGVFNPELSLAAYDRDWQKGLGINQGNLMGAMKIAGYRPGDSEPTNQLNTITAKAVDDRARFANDTRRQSFFDELNAYSALDANSAMGAAGIAANMGQQSTGYNTSLANFYGSKIQNPSGLLSYVMPYLQGSQQTPLAGSSSTVQNAGLAAFINGGGGRNDLLNIPGGQVGGGLNW